MTERSRPISRRRFLLGFAAGGAVVVAGFAVVKRKALQLVADKLRNNTSPYRLQPETGTGVLPAPVLEAVVAFSQVLIPWQTGADVVAEMTSDFVQGQCRFKPGALELYTSTVALLDEEAGGAGSFAALSAADRTALVTQLLPAPIRSRRDWRHVWNVVFRYEETRVAELVAGDLLMNFYNDDRSWTYLQEARAA